MSQNRKWLGLCDFYEGIKDPDAPLVQNGASFSFLILNPQVVKEIVTDIMIIISPYFLLDNILRNILVSWKVSLEEGLAHATSACLPPVSEQTLFSSMAVRIFKKPYILFSNSTKNRAFYLKGN